MRSLHTTVYRGVAPQLGHDVDDALTQIAKRKICLGAVLGYVGVERLTCVREIGSPIPRSQCCVGVLWSAVATIEPTRDGAPCLLQAFAAQGLPPVDEVAS